MPPSREKRIIFIYLLGHQYTKLKQPQNFVPTYKITSYHQYINNYSISSSVTGFGVDFAPRDPSASLCKVDDEELVLDGSSVCEGLLVVTPGFLASVATVDSTGGFW